MAQNPSGPSPRQFNGPRIVNVPPVTANPTLRQQVEDAIGGTEKLISFLKAFTAKRFQTTKWRVVKDVTSRDTREAAVNPNEPSTVVLAEPFQSLTAQLAAIVEDRTNGKIKMVRDESLGVLAALRDDQALLQTHGIKMWDTYNANGEYMTIGMSALPSGQIPEIAKKQALALEF